MIALQAHSSWHFVHGLRSLLHLRDLRQLRSERVANMQQTHPTSGHCLASHGNDDAAQIGEVGSAQVSAAQEKSPGLSGLGSKAGERIRTVDIHVGNVQSPVMQSAVTHEVTSIAVGARTKYAARNSLHIKRISALAVGEWPRDPDYARAV